MGQHHPFHSRAVIPAEGYRLMQAKHLRLPVPGRELLSEICTDKRHPLDVTGHYLFVCPSHRTILHDNMRDSFRAFCASAGLKAICEPTNCLAIQVTGAATKDRPDIALSNLDDLGRTLLLDVTPRCDDHGCSVHFKRRHAPDVRVNWCCSKATQSRQVTIVRPAGRPRETGFPRLGVRAVWSLWP